MNCVYMLCLREQVWMSSVVVGGEIEKGKIAADKGFQVVVKKPSRKKLNFIIWKFK